MIEGVTSQEMLMMIAVLAGFTLLGATVLSWRLFQTRRQLRRISSALAAAGDGLESLGKAGERNQEALGRLERLTSRCWRGLRDLQAGESRPQKPAGAGYTDSEAALLDWLASR